jgi:hypothetical protein
MVEKTYYKTKDYCKVKFVFETAGAKTIDILGLNGDWKKPVAMDKKKDGSFSCIINLPKKSEHQFKYRVNKAEWFNDASADGEAANEFGGTNSVIRV